MQKKDKLYWFYDELMIENYIKIKEVLNNSIELEHFLITGTKLQISKMDGYLLVIKGQIMMVRRKMMNIYSIKMKKSLFFKYSEKL